MKKLILLLSLLAIANANAIDSSLLITNNGSGVPAYSNIISGAARVQLLSLVNPNNLAMGTFYILDAPVAVTNINGTIASYVFTNMVTNASGQIGYSNAAYASIVQYTTNIKVFYTNFMGLTNFQVLGGTYTNNPVYQSNVLFTVTNTIGPITNSYRVLFSGSLGALATLTITNQFNVIYGLSELIPSPSSNTVNVTWSSSL